MKDKDFETSNIIKYSMPKPDPLEKILRDARKRTEKCVIKALKENNQDDILKYLRTYRGFTKLINREPLNIFDL